MSFKVNGSIGLPGQILSSSGTTDIISSWNDFDLAFHGPSLSYKKVVRLATTVDVGASITATKSVAVTGASGTGLLATLTFATQEYAPFLVGSTVTIASVVPAGYNATAIVVQCTTTSIKYYNTTTTAWTSGGTITATNLIMLGYTPNQVLACTTTAGSTTVTTTQTLGLRTSYAVLLPTIQLAGGSLVSSIANSTTFTITNIANITITSISGNGTTVTAVFAHQTFIPYATGASITVSGTVNYNSTWVVSGCTNTTVSWSSATTAAEAVGTIAFTIAAGTSISTTWSNAQPCTTTAASNNVTVSTSSNIKVGATVTNATVQIAAGTTVASITSATVIVLNARANLTITAISGTGTVVTATFAAQTYTPYAVGSSITVSGTVNHNGTWVVSGCTTTTVSWLGSAIAAEAVGAIAFTVAAGTSIITPFNQGVTALSVDSVAVANGDRILLKDQRTIGGVIDATAARYNGIYNVQYLGTTGLPWVLIRSPDADVSGDLDSAVVNVSIGTANFGKAYKTRFSGSSTLNTTEMYWGRVVDVLSSSLGPIPTTGVGVDISSDSETVMHKVGSIADYAANSFGIKTLQSTSATSTYTRASTVYIAGAPVASTNTAITTPYSVYIAGGNSYLGAACTATSFNSITGLASVAPLGDGTAAVGTSTLAARQDHVHPTSSATSVANALTINNGGAGAASGSTYNGSAAVTISHNTIGALALTGGTLTGQLISTDAYDAAANGGNIFLNSATGNRIDWNTNGVAAPAFTTRSAGTKLVLYPNVGAASVDFALGIENNTMWFSTYDNSAGAFKWYGGTTNTMSLLATGILSVVTGFRINNAATSGQYLRGNGTNFVSSTIQAADVPTLNQSTSGSAGSVANALTINNGGAGAASGSTYNGSAAVTISYNTVGAAAASHTHLYAGSSSAGGAANSVANAVTFNTGGAGAASGSTYNGSAAVTVSYNTVLGFFPVQQGGGTSQSTNKIYIGWSATSQLRLQVDATDFGTTWPINISGTPGSHTHSYLPLSGGTLTGQLTVPQGTSGGIRLQGAGNGYIVGTSGDAANATTANVKVGSWFGIGFAASISGQTVPLWENAAWIDARIGSFTCRNNITAYSSDERLKTNFTKIENPIEKIKQLNGYTFDWQIDKCKSLGFAPITKHEHGVKAQEVQKVIEDAVAIAPFDQDSDKDGNIISKSGENYLTVRPERIIPLLIESIKEQQTMIEELRQEINILKQQIGN